MIRQHKPKAVASTRHTLICLGIYAVTLLIAAALQAHEASSHASPASAAKGRGTNAALGAAPTLPPLPAGVAQLKFADFFKPIGDRGLEYSEMMRTLEGKRVRILGYMVRSDTPAAGMFLFAPKPMTLHESEYGLADDLPATVAHVFVAERQDEIVPYTPGPMLLTGTINLGPREEADGRISNVRLMLDAPPRARKAAKTAGKRSTATSRSTARAGSSVHAVSTTKRKAK